MNVSLKLIYQEKSTIPLKAGGSVELKYFENICGFSMTSFYLCGACRMYTLCTETTHISIAYGIAG